MKYWAITELGKKMHAGPVQEPVPSIAGYNGLYFVTQVMQCGGIVDSIDVIQLGYGNPDTVLVDWSMGAALKLGYVREATREEVLVYSLRGKL